MSDIVAGTVYTLAILGGVWAFVVFIAWRFQGAFLYFPDRTRVAPSAVGLPEQMREAKLLTHDGLSLITWRAAPVDPSRPVVLYCHGNARNLARRAGYFWLFMARGWGVAALSYRGYGGSQGRPSEADNVADAVRLYDQLLAEGVDPARIVVYGESLGSGVATMLAAQRAVAGLVVHAPYDAVEEVAAWRAPYILPRLTMRDRYRSIDAMTQVTAPVLWLHGDGDHVIPIRFGHRLYAAITAPKTAAIVKGAGHFDLYAPHVFEAHVRGFVERVAGEGPDTRPTLNGAHEPAALTHAPVHPDLSPPAAAQP